jgi:transposase
MDLIEEIIRQRKSGEKIRAIARNLGISRNTVKQYLQTARTEKAEVPSATTAPNILVATALEIQVKAWRESKAPIKRCWEEARRLQLFTKSYATFSRFVNKFEDAELAPTKVFVPIETAPGDEAQIDFMDGPAMYNPDLGKNQKTQVFIMRMSYSRADFAVITWRQDAVTWLRCMEAGFKFFGGVPAAIRCDNAKALINKAYFIEPLLSKTFFDFAKHYNFVVRNCRVSTPRHKGKVERLGQYVQTSFLPLRAFKSIDDANSQLGTWLKEVANQRKHGVTLWVPWEEFESVERAVLKPLNEAHFEMGRWGRAKLHQDCHVSIERKLYSAPWQLRRKELDYRITQTQVQIFYQHKLIATHVVCTGKEFRRTDKDHLPPLKVAYMEKTPQWCLEAAEKMGEDVLSFVQKLLGKSDHPFENLRSAQGIIRLGQKYGSPRLQLACARALRFNNLRYRAIEDILKKGLEGETSQQELFDPKAPTAQETSQAADPPRFTRGSKYFH